MTEQPIPTNTLLVGGKRNGERMTLPDDRRVVRVPWVPPLQASFRADYEESTSYHIDTYERRTLRPCYDAAPVHVWVLCGLPDDVATALYQEWL